MKPGRLALTVSTLALVGCDQATKLAARAALPAHPISLLRGWLQLRYVENRDVAFSLTHAWRGPGKALALAAVAAVLIAALAVTWARRRLAASPLEHLSYACLLAGALGNLVDRVVRGAVIDFVYVRYYSVFNVADVLIVLGAVGWVLARRHQSLETGRAKRTAAH